MSAESEVKVAKNRSQIYLAELTTEGSKRRPKIQPKGFVARKPARTKAQSPSVRIPTILSGQAIFGSCHRTLIYKLFNSIKLLWFSNGLREFPEKANYFLFAARGLSKHYCLRERSDRVVMRGQTRNNEPGNYLKPWFFFRFLSLHQGKERNNCIVGNRENDDPKNTLRLPFYSLP